MIEYRCDACDAFFDNERALATHEHQRHEPIRRQLRRKKSLPRPGSMCECGCEATVYATYGDEIHDYCQPCYVDAVNAKTDRAPRLEPTQAEIDDAIASIQTAVQNGAST